MYCVNHLVGIWIFRRPAGITFSSEETFCSWQTSRVRNTADFDPNEIWSGKTRMRPPKSANRGFTSKKTTAKWTSGWRSRCRRIARSGGRETWPSSLPSSSLVADPRITTSGLVQTLKIVSGIYNNYFKWVTDKVFCIKPKSFLKELSRISKRKISSSWTVISKWT